MALATVGGNISLLKRGINRFIERYPGELDQIQEALDTSNSQLLNKTAHSLKGEAGMIGANGAFDLAQKFEEMGENNELKDGFAIFDKFKEELDRINRFVSMINWDEMEW